MLEDKLTSQELLEMNSCIQLVRNKEYTKTKRYIIPGRTEDPRVDYGMLRNWFMEFHQLNPHIPKPKRFYNKNKTQLIGMFNGYLTTYNIRLKDIIGPR